MKLMRRKVAPMPTTDSKEESKAEGGEVKPPPAPEEGESLGFGFVSYTTIEAASRARAEVKVKPFKG